ncbi:MAG: cupin domain-containing protein [Chloroflexota bacterium]|nr:cupin domain-containing protein [Chloroflexota bacterium]
MTQASQPPARTGGQPPNQVLTHLWELVKQKGPPPWSQRIIYNKDVQATLICRAPGGANRPHYHSDNDEFWLVLQGEMVWEIEGMQPVHAVPGDVVLVPTGKAHLIRTVGDGPSLRFAIVVPDVPHLDPKTGKPW